MEFEANDASIDLLMQAPRQRGIAFAKEAQIHGEGVGRLKHALNVPRPGRTGGGKGAGGRARATPHHGGHPTGQCFFNLLRADEMNVAVNAARGDDVALAADHFGAGADDDVHAGLHVGVAGLADGHDAPALKADVGLDDAPVVQDESVGHHAVHGTFCARALALRHAVADGFAATKFDFFAIGARAQSQVLFDFNQQVGVGQAHPVAHGGAKNLGVGASSNGGHYKVSFDEGLMGVGWVSSGPWVRPLNPNTTRSPAKSTSSTVRCWPGSKRTAKPEAMFRRMPWAAERSKPSAALVSAKW